MRVVCWRRTVAVSISTIMKMSSIIRMSAIFEVAMPLSPRLVAYVTCTYRSVLSRITLLMTLVTNEVRRNSRHAMSGILRRAGIRYLLKSLQTSMTVRSRTAHAIVFAAVFGSGEA